MGIILFMCFLMLAYLYMTELIIPWYNKPKFNQFKDTSLISIRNPDFDAKQIEITTTNLPPLKVTLPMGTIMATTVVNIMKPVLLISKQDDIRIYYPDNSIEYLSVLSKKWEKVQTTYNSVYEYATRTNCIIVENL